MASPLICYFSATGNSLAVARDLADDLDGRLVSISSTLGQNSVANDADTVGFVFPIYDFKPPSAVIDLVGRIDQIGSKYVFAICTYGWTSRQEKPATAAGSVSMSVLWTTSD